MSSQNEYEQLVGEALLKLRQAEEQLLLTIPSIGVISKVEWSLNLFAAYQAEALSSLANLKIKEIEKKLSGVLDNVKREP